MSFIIGDGEVKLYYLKKGYTFEAHNDVTSIFITGITKEELCALMHGIIDFIEGIDAHLREYPE